MNQLVIDEKKARQLYPSASGELKTLLEENFQINVLSDKITDKVKNFDDILVLAGKVMQDIAKPGDTDDEIAYKQAKLISDVYNEGTVLDPGNTSQYKYYPWHKIVKDPSKFSGFGLSYDVYDDWCTASGVGVRLCFKNEQLAIDAGTKFLDIYERLKIR